ncbi:response regulator transcription factor [Bacillus sp. V2I10]|uniref:response regulator transcription factor n=1 Tax=Bacillus sp. V2I10 TaxID=3042276 RepID=UPI00277F7159|nr:response regulator transcription factor [Bacillus sp. V2I10]MDQ0859907.1 two-component system response regulator ResD [Bacillus sp. V2I10]
MKKLLIVDDEWNMRNLLKIYLSADFSIFEASDGEEAIDLIRTSQFDLIILDIMLPGMDGWKVCSEIRKIKSTPILMLTARNELKDKVYGLEIGTDDYLIKPFEPEELSARVKALIRRTEMNIEESQAALSFGNGFFTLNTDGRIVTVAGDTLDLTPKEFELLHTIAANPKRVFTREVLLDVLWGYNDYRDTRTVDSHTKNIRVKIREKGQDYNPIQTIWDVGYKFQEPDESL